MVSVSLSRRSVGWVLADTLATAVLSIGTMLVLARLVGPSDFGLASLIVGIVLSINLYAEGLFHDALIQAQNLPDAAFDEAFSFVLLVACGVISLALIGALLQRDTEWATSAWLFAAGSLSLAFSGPLGVANARFRREMQYREVARASVIGKLIGCASSISLAWFGFGTWGILAQYALGIVAQTLILYMSGGWRPRFGFSFQSVPTLLRFALPNAVMHTIVATRIQGFAILVASLMGLSAAGFVNLAFRITTTPLVALSTTFSNLCFPLLARHQKSPPDLANAYVLATKIITIASAPLFVGLALVADDFVPLLLGPGWEPSVLPVKLIALAAALNLARMSSSLVLRALGHVRYSFWNAVMQLFVTIGGLALLRPTDTLVAVILWVAPNALVAPLSWIIVQRVTGMPLATQWRGLLPAGIATAVMAVVVVAFRSEAAALGTATQLAIAVGVGGAVYVVTVLTIDADLRRIIYRRAALDTVS